MAYEPTEWVRGTKITAQKLNNIEQGVQSVNSEYTPTTWAEGDIVTATKLNNIEQGIAYAGGGGGGDFSTAQVTVAAEAEGIATAFYYLPTILENFFSTECILATAMAAHDDERTYTVVLYKGKCCFFWDGEPDDPLPIVSGNATYDSENHVVTITGDCKLLGRTLL